MRFLADENFPGEAVNALRAAGHDVLWAATDLASVRDPDVLARAIGDRRVLLTFDKDFGELVFRAGLPADSGVVLFRVHGLSVAERAQLVVNVLKQRIEWAGHFTVVRRDRLRSVPLPSGPTPKR